MMFKKNENILKLIKSEIVLSVLIFAISLLTFSCVLTADFVQWDDDIIIYENPKLTGFSFESVKWAFTDVDSMTRYNPLTLLGWSFTHYLWGFEPFWFHLGNWLLHAFSSILVFWIIRKMLLLKMEDPKEIALLWINVSAAIATLIWAIHPLRVEPVSWATDTGGKQHENPSFYSLQCRYPLLSLRFEVSRTLSYAA